MFGYLILISIYFFDFISPFFSLVLVSIEKICQKPKKVFDYISKHLEDRKNTSLHRVVFSPPLDVLNCGKTRFFCVSCTI